MILEPRANPALRHRPYDHVCQNAVKRLRVMKFGGTSVGDASCIRRVADIVQATWAQSNVVVVVSAMSGVTDKLIQALCNLEAADLKRVELILDELQERHKVALAGLVRSGAARNRIVHRMAGLLQETYRQCHVAAQRHELTPCMRDFIASLGERLSAPLVAATLRERGLPSEVIEATAIIVTNSYPGAAEPLMGPTRERCAARLRPLLQKGIVPVVTGFIGATTEGVLTTLGRGGSDYSATILAAALSADDVTIWTDVDGLLTADPRLVPNASTVREVSYEQAAKLAQFGAKVLHPKTVCPVVQYGIPIWIRNTFAPERPGTKVTATGPATGGGVKAVTAVGDVALITISGSGIVAESDVVNRVASATAAVGVHPLLASWSFSKTEVYLIVGSSLAQRTLNALRCEFTRALAKGEAGQLIINPTMALVTMLGENNASECEIVSRTLRALRREGVSIFAVGAGPSEPNVSFVVREEDLKATLLITHRELQVGQA